MSYRGTNVSKLDGPVHWGKPAIPLLHSHEVGTFLTTVNPPIFGALGMRRRGFRAGRRFLRIFLAIYNLGEDNKYGVTRHRVVARA